MKITILTLVVCTQVLAITFLFSGWVYAQPQSKLARQMLDLPAPAPGRQGEIDRKEIERPDDFYLWKNMPPDDAPIEDLLEYWKEDYGNGNTLTYKVPPSPKVLERLIDHCRDNPQKLISLLGHMPVNEQAVAGVKEIYEKLKDDPSGVYLSKTAKLWLSHNSNMFAGELEKQARKIKDENDYVSNEDQIALRSLAKHDWDAARPHVDRLEYDVLQPYSQILAFWIKYQRAVDMGDSSDTESYRAKLKRIVENRSAAWAQRDLAMDALVAGGDWDGRDDWYFSLLNDETLLTIQDNGYTGLTTMLVAAPPDKWKERLIKIVKTGDRTARTAAARNLMTELIDKETVEALIPWITDKDWAKESGKQERNELIESLGDIDIPEAVSLLITVLTNEEELTHIAAKALGLRKDPRAGPALRMALTRDNDSETREAVINALVGCGGFSDDEQMAALETYLTLISTEKGREAYEQMKADSDDGPDMDDDSEEDESAPRKKKVKSIPSELSIGEYISAIDEPSEGLAMRAIERERTLRKTKPDVSVKLAEVIKSWKGRAIYLELLRRLKLGEGDMDTLLDILTQRKDIREKLPNEVASMRSTGGFLRGVGACVAENEADFLSIIGTGDPESQVSALGCARMIRAKIPVDEVARLLDENDPNLKLAAERYLESEDSVRARTIVLSRRLGEASLLGARQAFVPNPRSAYTSESLSALFVSVNGGGFWSANNPGIQRHEEKLQAEIKDDANLIAIYAKLTDAVSGHQVIRVYRDRVRYTFYEDAARYREGELTEKEFKDFHNFVLSSKIDELPPTMQMCNHGCPFGEFVMFGRNGGRRTFFSSYSLSGVLGKVDEFYEAFKRKDLKLNYLLAEKINGLEVILADDKFPVHAVWKKDADLRFLVSDVDKRQQIQQDLDEKTRQENETEAEEDNAEQRSARYQAQEQRRRDSIGREFSWRTIANGKLGPEVLKPEAIPIDPKGMSTMLPRGGAMKYPGRILDGEDTDSVIYANRYMGGIFRSERGHIEPVRIKEGAYEMR